VTIPDYPDWTQPVTQIEQVTVIPLPGGNLVANDPAVTIDVQRYASVLIGIGSPAAAVGSRYVVGATWGNLNSDVDYDSVAFHARTTYPATYSGPSWQLPVRGSHLTLQAWGDTNASLPVLVLGSTRAISGVTVTDDQTRLGRLLLDTGSINVPASSTSATSYIRPVSRAVRIVSSYQPNIITVNLQGVNATGGVAQSIRTWRNVQPANPATWDDILAAGVALEMSVINSDTVAHSGSVQVWDVS